MSTEKPLSDTALIFEQISKELGGFATKPIIAKWPMLVAVISGPSGVGKDAVVRELQKQRKNLHFVVTATSRAMREREVDGVDYHFVSKETFQKWIDEGRMYEFAEVYGDFKGVPKTQIEAAFEKGEDCILRLDVQGAEHLRKLHPDCVTIFIVPNSEEELAKRLINRKTETLENLRIRVQTARKELQRASEFDYVVLNKEGSIKAAASQIGSILDAEKMKRTRLQAEGVIDLS